MTSASQPPCHAAWMAQVKQARGAIVRHMCLLGATHPSELKSFTGENWVEAVAAIKP